jgi:DNA-binding transcriptional LysR family regulator
MNNTDERILFMRNIDLAGVEIFKAVAEQGGITRAAARLHRVQSNVTTVEDALRGELSRRRAGRARGSAGGRSIAART